MRISGEAIAGMEDRYRAFFVNSLSGFKSVNLVGTSSAEGLHNLAIVSSVVHIGSHPPLLAMISRPHTVRRDTLENIHATGAYTINHVNSDMMLRAHQTAARYDAHESEFDMVGLGVWHSEHHAAPYVAESSLRIGLQHRETVDLTINGCHMVIGEVTEVFVDESSVGPDGAILLDSLVVSGLDHYHRAQPLARLAYAKPDREPQLLRA